MQLRALHAFVEVVRQGGFSQAAKTVFATQSTVSKAVKALEEELGMALLNRIGHRSELTAAGEVVYRRAMAMLGERENLLGELDELRGLKRGTLRVGFPPIGSDILFAPLFAAYRSRNPGVDIRLLEYGSKRLQECLQTGEIELAALLAPVESEFEWQHVRTEPLMALLASNHPCTEKGSISLASLAEFPFILFAEGFALNPIILGACKRAGFEPRVVARSGQIDFVVELVAAGVGVAFLPRMIAERHPHPGIQRVSLDDPALEWHMVLAWRQGAFLSHAARAWLALAREIRYG